MGLTYTGHEWDYLWPVFHSADSGWQLHRCGHGEQCKLYRHGETGTLVISGGTATVTLGNLAQVYTGSPLAATATTSPAGLTVVFTYTGATGQPMARRPTPPTSAGSYTVVGTVSGGNNSGPASGTLVIAKAPATVTLGDLAQTYSGSPSAATSATSSYWPDGGTDVHRHERDNLWPVLHSTHCAGSYTVAGAVSNANYSGAASGTMVIGQLASAIKCKLQCEPGSGSDGPHLDSDGFGATSVRRAGTVTFLDGTTPSWPGNADRPYGFADHILRWRLARIPSPPITAEIPTSPGRPVAR